MKKCTECETEKEESEFTLRTDNGKLASNCRLCKATYKRTHYQSVKYLPEQRWTHLTGAARKRQVELTITKTEFLSLVVRNCFYCECSIALEVGSGLDRIDNSKGYSFDNVVTCCARCNLGRTNRFTHEEWKVMIDALKRWRG